MDQSFQSQTQLTTKPKNWLVESILATIFCCLPFGIAGIVFATQVNSKYDAGDYEGALKASKDAGKWTKVAFFVGLAIYVIYFAVTLIWGVAIFNAARTNGDSY